MSDEQEIQFPNYQPPSGPPLADRKQQGPLVKLMTRMLPKKIKPKLLGKAKHTFHHKGLEADQKVHIKKKQVKFY